MPGVVLEEAGGSLMPAAQAKETCFSQAKPLKDHIISLRVEEEMPQLHTGWSSPWQQWSQRPELYTGA